MLMSLLLDKKITDQIVQAIDEVVEKPQAKAKPRPKTVYPRRECKVHGLTQHIRDTNGQGRSYYRCKQCNADRSARWRDQKERNKQEVEDVLRRIAEGEWQDVASIREVAAAAIKGTALAA